MTFPKTWVTEDDPLGPPLNPGIATPLTGAAVRAEFQAAKDYADSRGGAQFSITDRGASGDGTDDHAAFAEAISDAGAAVAAGAKAGIVTLPPLKDPDAYYGVDMLAGGDLLLPEFVEIQGFGRASQIRRIGAFAYSNPTALFRSAVQNRDITAPVFRSLYVDGNDPLDPGVNSSDMDFRAIRIDMDDSFVTHLNGPQDLEAQGYAGVVSVADAPASGRFACWGRIYTYSGTTTSPGPRLTGLKRIAGEPGTIPDLSPVWGFYVAQGFHPFDVFIRDFPGQAITVENVWRFSDPLCRTKDVRRASFVAQKSSGWGKLTGDYLDGNDDRIALNGDKGMQGMRCFDVAVGPGIITSKPDSYWGGAGTGNNGLAFRAVWRVNVVGRKIYDSNKNGISVEPQGLSPSEHVYIDSTTEIDGTLTGRGVYVGAATGPSEPQKTLPQAGRDVLIDCQIRNTNKEAVLTQPFGPTADIDDVRLGPNAMFDKCGSGSQPSVGVEPSDDGIDEVQSVTVNATGGTYTLTFDDTGTNPQTTAAIAYNATAAQLKAALEALSNVAAGDVYVIGGPGGASPIAYNVRFMQTLGNANRVQMTANSTGLTGGTATAAVATVTGGAAPYATDPTTSPGIVRRFRSKAQIRRASGSAYRFQTGSDVRDFVIDADIDRANDAANASTPAVYLRGAGDGRVRGRIVDSSGAARANYAVDASEGTYDPLIVEADLWTPPSHFATGRVKGRSLDPVYGDRNLEASNVIATANLLYFAEVAIDRHSLRTGLIFRTGGTTTAGNVIAVLFNAAGARVAVSASAAVAAISTNQQVVFGTAVYVPAGTYFAALMFSDGTCQFQGTRKAVRSGTAAQGSFAAPTSITVPTGIDTNRQPVAAVY